MKSFVVFAVIGRSYCEFTIRQHRPHDRDRVIVDSSRAPWSGPDAQGHAWLPLHRHGGEQV